MAGEHRNAVHPGVVTEEVASEADLAAATGHQHLLIEIRPLLDGSLLTASLGGRGGSLGAGKRGRQGRTMRQERLYY
jgi:hypothetical protein